MAYSAWKVHNPDHVFKDNDTLPAMGIPPAHVKHPIAIWIAASKQHYAFAIDVARMLLVLRDRMREDLTSKPSPLLLHHVKRLQKAGPPPDMPDHCSYEELVHRIESCIPPKPPPKRVPKTPPPPKRMRCVVAGRDLPDGIQGFPLAFGYAKSDDFGSILLKKIYTQPHPEMAARSLPAIELYNSYYASKTHLQ